jgi:two-component system cell cycle response regulator
MEKYQKLFLDRVEKMLKQWEEKGHVEEKAIYRFLHTVKGTAASIGLIEISDLAEKKLVQLEEVEERHWSNEEWQQFLMFLIRNEMKYSEINHEEEIIENITENEKLLLLIDDDITMINLLKGHLEKQGYMVLAALTAKRALQLFYDQKPDCIILDIYLPDQEGFELLDTLMEKSQSNFIPIMLISSDNKKETRIRGYQRGAVDFIAKPFDLDELTVRLENRISFKDKINNAVLVDELTGAFNRKFFKTGLNCNLFELTKSKESFSLVMIDLDNFKNVNDRYGHFVGDDVLRGFAQFMLKNIRESDYLVRYGGEEFMLILPDTKQHDAKTFVERLLQDFGEITFFSEGGTSFSVTFSAGVVEMGNTEIHLDEYLKQVDLALFNAKEHGKNQVSVYEDTRTLLSTDKNIYIAIIDDDAVVHHLVTEHLSKLSFGNYQVDIKSFREGEVFFASDWHKQTGKFLILLDGIMPRMDGLEVLRKLRTDYSEQKFVVLMLTGRKSEQDIVRALELGADDYLTKPFNVAELEARVKCLVKRMLM